MKTIKLLCTILFIGYLSNSYCQQEVQFTHYMYNTLSVNPGYAGSKNLLNVSSLLRQQWIGIDGAPMTQNIYLHSPIPTKNMGVGLSFVNDKVGPIGQTSIAADYSYTINLNSQSKLSVGIKSMVNFIQANLKGLKLDQQNDPSFSSNTVKVTPNVGLGIYYHKDKWYAGISTPKLLESEINAGNTTTVSKLNRHYYIIGGYVASLNQDWKLKPAFLVKLTQNAPVSIDMSLETYFKNKISLGIMHRWEDSFGFLVGYQLSNQLRAGVSFDQTISRLSNYNNGTFEMFLSYDFLFSNDKIISPRYF